MMSPYRIPVFNALNARLGGRLRVFFLAERAGRRWPVYRDEIQFPYRVLPGIALRVLRDSSHILYLNVPVALYLRRAGVGPVFVGGYNHLEFVWSTAHARARRRPAILWSESVDAAEGGRPVRSALKRAAVRACDGYLVPGIRAARQVTFLGADESRVFTAPNAVDVSFWAAGAPDPAARRGAPRLIFVGSLIARKGLDLVLEALDDDRLRHLTLDVVGEGPERTALESAARERGVKTSFLGHLDREPLRERYRAADIVVFPTRSDPWGLVLNEAMAAGCVPVTSRAAGASEDLVQPRRTGLVVPPDDPGALREALLELACDPGGLTQLASAASARAALQTPERCADGFVHALEALL
jgi:glycosyltransferase involved in cell wall biosynthesis